MTITAAGDLSEPLENAKILLAACPTFQALMLKATAAKTLTRIFLVETEELFQESEDREQCPNRCIVGYPPDGFRFAKATTTGWTLTGPIVARIEVQTPADLRDPGNQQSAILWFMNQIGLILREAVNLSTSGADRGDGKTHLNITVIGVEEFGRIDPTEFNGQKAYGADLWIEWRGS